MYGNVLWKFCIYGSITHLSLDVPCTDINHMILVHSFWVPEKSRKKLFLLWQDDDARLLMYMHTVHLTFYCDDVLVIQQHTLLYGCLGAWFIAYLYFNHVDARSLHHSNDGSFWLPNPSDASCHVSWLYNGCLWYGCICLLMYRIQSTEWQWSGVLVFGPSLQ